MSDEITQTPIEPTPITPAPTTPISDNWSRMVIVGGFAVCLLAIVGALIAGMIIDKDVPSEALSLATLIAGILAAIVTPSKK